MYNITYRKLRADSDMTCGHCPENGWMQGFPIIKIQRRHIMRSTGRQCLIKCGKREGEDKTMNKHSKKKAVAGILGILGIIALGIGIGVESSKEAATIAIIGGADGPTSVFVAGKIGGWDILGICAVIVGIILLGIAVIRLILKKTGKK